MNGWPAAWAVATAALAQAPRPALVSKRWFAMCWAARNKVVHGAAEDAATKLLWLALRNITTDWGRAAKDWKEAMNQSAILYEDRFTKVAA
jgi:hypothetical protein